MDGRLGNSNMKPRISNTNVVSEQLLVSPQELHQRFPRSDRATSVVDHGRREIEAILDRNDPRLLLVVGPCSIHDIKLAQEYAERLLALRDQVSASMNVVMRVYFEKPRTTVGWKGFINDPHLDDSFDIAEGLAQARELLVSLAEMGLPTGTEALDPISPQYLSDLFSWAAIGARTTESQTHREMSSGLSMPVGFKNGTDGSLAVAINALRSASSAHRFLGINVEGRATILETRGNDYGHVILRGGKEPNFDAVNVALAEKALQEANLDARIIIDCAHANSHKNHELQPLVAINIVDQIVAGNRSIVGAMIESNVNAGNQPLNGNRESLQYGVSVTDACVDWETTEKTVLEMHEKLLPVLAQR